MSTRATPSPVPGPTTATVPDSAVRRGPPMTSRLDDGASMTARACAARSLTKRNRRKPSCRSSCGRSKRQGELVSCTLSTPVGAAIATAPDESGWRRRRSLCPARKDSIASPGPGKSSVMQRQRASTSPVNVNNARRQLVPPTSPTSARVPGRSPTCIASLRPPYQKTVYTAASIARTTAAPTL